MKFVVLFEDATDASADVRRKHMSDHLSFLEKHSTIIDAAGPLQDSNGNGAGGLWIVSSENESEVLRLVKEDPFWPTGLRKSVQVLSWTQVFADGRCLVKP